MTELTPTSVWRRLATSEASPWVFLVVLSFVFWIIESALHTVMFERRGMLANLLRPEPHELWMRIVVLVMMVVVAVVWTAALRSRRTRIEQLEEQRARLRELSAAVVAGDDAGRREISGRLHESVAQSLVAARLFLTGLEERCAVEDLDTLRSVEGIIDDVITQIREIALEMSPPALEEFGLHAALETLASRVMRRTGTSVELVGEPHYDGPSCRETLLATYPVLAEVVESAASDPGTTTVRVSAAASDGTVTIVVEWDGSASREHFALEERLLSAGGSIECAPVSGGTRVSLHAPLVCA